MNAYQHDSDEALVAMLITGDAKAFGAIYKRYASQLYRYAQRNISSREECEEIIQGVFESLWTRHKELEHVTVLNAYLFRMVRYKVIHYFRHSNVRKKYIEHYKLFEAVYDSINIEERDPDNIQVMIERSLSELPERCQLAIRLRLTENLSNDDIAKRMNIKKSTVENYMVTAISHLRATYQGLYKAG